jgi:hypothetical protein
MAFAIPEAGMYLQKYTATGDPWFEEPIPLIEGSHHDNLALTPDGEGGVWVTFRRDLFHQIMVVHVDEEGNPAASWWEDGPLPILPGGTAQRVMGTSMDDRDGLLIALAASKSAPLEGEAAPIVVQRMRDSADNVKNEEYGAARPETLQFLGAWPNPFNSRITIRFLLTGTRPMEGRVYDILGREVATLTRGVFVAGQHSLHWDGRSNTNCEVSSGVYFVELKTPEARLVKRVLLLR